MPYRFIFFTWFLVIPVNLIAVILALTVSTWIRFGNLPVHQLLPDFEGIIVVAVFSIVFSIPGLIGLTMVVSIARDFLFDVRTQFFFICISCAFLTAGCYLLLEVILSPGFQVTEYLLLLTASISAIIIVLLFTRRYYYSYLKSLS